jgi:hypothetical protein
VNSVLLVSFARERTWIRICPASTDGKKFCPRNGTDGVARAVGDNHFSAMDHDCDQRRAVEHQLQQREEDDRSERPIEEKNDRTREFGREHRTRREPAPKMVLGQMLLQSILATLERAVGALIDRQRSAGYLEIRRRNGRCWRTADTRV